MSILSSTKTGKSYYFFPKTKEDLQKLIKKEIDKNGINCSLNHIDVSAIKDMSRLFCRYDELGFGRYIYVFDGDISNWDVSNVTNMSQMFCGSTFTGEKGDISNWNVNNVKYMYSMFKDSWFCSNLSNWKLNENCETYNMFFNCHLRLSKKPFKNNIRML
jgi:hypothetical protein